MPSHKPIPMTESERSPASPQDFDAVVARFTGRIRYACNWKHNYHGAAYSTRVNSAIKEIEDAIREVRLHPEFAASPPASPSPTIFWVVERFENGKSQGYWDGGSSRYFVLDINEAVQFRRRQDAQNVIVGWHWKDVEITEHMMLPASAPPSPAGRGEYSKVGGFLRSHLVRSANDAHTKGWNDALEAADELLARKVSIGISHFDLCHLSRVFNASAYLGSGTQDEKINNWLKDQIAGALSAAPSSNGMREALERARPYVERQADVESGLDHDPNEKCAATCLKQIDAALDALPPAPVGREETCYIERSKVREIMISVSDEFVAITEVLLADIDALPIYTWPPAPTQSALKNTEKRLQKLESLGLDEAADFARLANEDKTPENPVVGSEQWRPIETAPKDGTLIWMWSPEQEFGGANQFVGQWSEMHGWWIDEGDTRDLSEYPATHWMPLPAAPPSNDGPRSGEGE